MSQKRAVDASGTPVPHCSGSDLHGMGTRSGSTTDEKLDAFKICTLKRRSHKFLLPVWIHISRKNLWIFRPDLQRWNRISAPSLHVCARSTHTQPQHQMYLVRQGPGLHSNKLTASQPQGPMAQDHLMTTETHHEDLILSPAPKMNNHEVPTYFDSLANNTSKGLQSGSIPFWEESNMLACNKLVRIHCKVGSASVRLVSETRGKCQDFVARFEDDGIPCAINSPLCCTNSTITVRQYRSIEDREIGKQFVPLWRELADQLKVLFPDGDDEGVFFLPALDARSQILSIKDSRNGIGKLVFKFAPLGSGQTLLLLHLICLFLAFRLRCCNGFSLKLTGLMRDGRTLASPLFRRIAGRGAFSFVSCFDCFYAWWPFDSRFEFA